MLELNQDEHADRRQRGLGAVSSTGLLHALWSLPAGITFPRSALDPLDLATLTEIGQSWVDLDEISITRRYRPIGTVELVAVAHSSLAQAAARVGEHPASFQRLAVWLTSRRPPATKRPPSFETAQARGIGVAAVGDWGCSVLGAPAAKVAGRPAVYRWWLAELAYRNWLTQTAPTGLAATWA